MIEPQEKLSVTGRQRTKLYGYFCFGLPPLLPFLRAASAFFFDFIEPSATAAEFLAFITKVNHVSGKNTLYFDCSVNFFGAIEIMRFVFASGADDCWKR